MTVPTNIFNSTQPFLLFENTLPKADEAAWLFTTPTHTITAHTMDKVKPALQQIDVYRKAGFYLAGYISYEASYALHPSLTELKGTYDKAQPLLQFMAFQNVTRPSVETVSQLLNTLPEDPPYITALHTLEQEATYRGKLQKIRQYLTSGDTYQVNHTFRLQFQLQGSKPGLYQTLRQRQPVAYSAYLQLPERTFLSLSPELFLSKRKNLLTSKPMKGTGPCGKTTAEDQEIIRQMQTDPKLHAENLMIVDLMRNDIGRLANIGSVRVENLFEIERYPTVHQMISTIHGEVAPDINFTEVMAGLFPCGSITGTPKLRTMEIIHELESTPRGVYTGAIGFITPDNDFTFNVPIRTLDFPVNSQQATLGIGGGIILDSDAKDEFQEALLKARFVTDINNDLKLIETMRYCQSSQSIPYLTQHLNRLSHSAGKLGFAFDRQKLQAELEVRPPDTTQDLKVRVLLTAAGEYSITSSLLESTFQPFEDKDQPATTTLPSIIIHPDTIAADSFFKQHKSTRRERYNEAFAQAEKQGHYDVIFFNQYQQLAEASRHNVIIKLGGEYITPPLDAGALPGVMRQRLLREEQIATAPISLEMLQSSEAVYLCNAVRGVVRCRLQE